MTKENLCTVKYKLLMLYETLDGKALQQFGFRIRDVSLDKLVDYLYAPKDSSALAVTRILFGLAMLCDIPDERGGAAMVERWGDPMTCHFPLLPFLRAVPMPYMALVYAALWFGAFGITLGYKYRVSSAVFALCYWYLFLIEKSFWNNHSYLFGLVAVLLCFTNAHCYWSVDAFLDASVKKETVPYWNYFILKFQFFILYFMAGVQKGSAEWLSGYSVQNLSEHWVFNPFKLFLTVPQTDYLVVHWFVFAFDLTVAVWMMWGRTRHIAMIFCALFHLMNSRLFSIGMFPWVCLATMPLFYPFDWPKTVATSLNTQYLRVRRNFSIFLRRSQNNKLVKCDQVTEDEKGVQSIKENPKAKEVLNDSKNNATENGKEKENCSDDNNSDNTTKNENYDTSDSHTKKNDDEVNETMIANDKMDNSEMKGTDGTNGPTVIEEQKENLSKMLTMILIFIYVLAQLFLPFSHFITQGYNNWTNGLYGYSWDMMIHTWDTHSVVVKIVDNDKNAEFFIDPYLYAPNERWTRHGDMVHQYAKCLKDNLLGQMKKKGIENAMSKNISIYVDVWISMNGRFTQRMFDPKRDLLNVSWSPFVPMSYLMPLLDEALSWRSVLQDIRQEVHSWHVASDVIFIADFPGYDQEKYISTDLDNVTLTVLEGLVVYEPEVSTSFNGQSHQLTTGDQMILNSGIFHKIYNIGENPAYYMYTFVNSSDIHNNVNFNKSFPKLPLTLELSRRVNNMVTFVHIVITNVLQAFFKLTRCQ